MQDSNQRVESVKQSINKKSPKSQQKHSKSSQALGKVGSQRSAKMALIEQAYLNKNLVPHTSSQVTSVKSSTDEKPKIDGDPLTVTPIKIKRADLQQ